MEIEKKYLVKEVPFDYKRYPHKVIEQGYISVEPVIRIRRADDRFFLTVKSKGLLARQEFEMDIEESSYQTLLPKVDGNIVSKRRYVIPLTDTDGSTGDPALDGLLKIELDLFEGVYQGLIYAEVEFPSEAAANDFKAPAWFYKDVTLDGVYHNSNLSRMDEKQRRQFLQNIEMI